MSDQKWVWRTPSWVNPHIERYLTDPEAAHLWDGTKAGLAAEVPTLLLTTIGRRSGQPRHSPLVYRPIDGGYCIIASKGGFPDHPDWYLNLVAQPNCEIRVSSLHARATGRVSTGEERQRLWDMMREIYPPFDAYQARTEREIPVIVLDHIEPISA